jgi:hypothetical protein
MPPFVEQRLRSENQSHASYCRQTTQTLITALALRLTADDEPDYDGIEVLAKLLDAHAHHVDVSTALIRMKSAEASA